jgi:hypothetical protein
MTAFDLPSVVDSGPEDLGWAPSQRLPPSEGSLQADRRWPRDGSGSVRGCGHVTVAAVHRSGGLGRPSFWQSYCAGHAYARGVVVGEESLEWTWEYLQLPARRTRR